MTDPLAPLATLPGVSEAAESARDAVSKVHRHRANLRGWPVTAAEAAVRAARSSSALDGGTMKLSADGAVDDPILAGALRVGQALDGDGLSQMTSVWSRAPLQALARLHVLAATGMADEDTLGRPRPGVDTDRLELLAQLISGGTSVSAPILAAIAHGELLTLNPFGSADGVVARAASRLVTVSRGLDPHALGVPEVMWMRQSGRYRELSSAFAEGTPDAIAAWIIFCCQALTAGAAEATSIADTASS